MTDEVTRLFTIPEFLWRESAARTLAIALPIELQQLGPLTGLEPATVGVDGIRAFTTPQIELISPFLLIGAGLKPGATKPMTAHTCSTTPLTILLFAD